MTGSITGRARRLVALLVAGIAVLQAVTAGTHAAASPSYDTVVLADRPTAFWRLAGPDRATERSVVGSSRLAGTYAGTRTATTLPNGDRATAFDGATGYFEVADNAALSPATRGVFTLEAWMRPDTLQFPHDEKAGYAHWMGKGTDGQYEYVARMYSLVNGEERPNRISGYQFDLAGGLGAGSYFQDPVVAGTWIHYVLVINANAKSTSFPNGYTKVYRDGVLRDQDDLSIRGTVIVPERGSAPFRVGTRDFGSWFQGAVGKVATYDRELSPAQILRHYQKMEPGS